LNAPHHGARPPPPPKSVTKVGDRLICVGSKRMEEIVIAHKPNLIVTAKKMLYALEVMREAIEKRRPRNYREAMVMIDTFDVIVTETARECADDMAPV
jgi:hypothetical protein